MLLLLCGLAPPQIAMASGQSAALTIGDVVVSPASVGPGGLLSLSYVVSGLPDGATGQTMTASVHLRPGDQTWIVPVTIGSARPDPVQLQLAVPADLASRRYEGQIRVALADGSQSGLATFSVDVLSPGPPGDLPEAPYAALLPLILLLLLPAARRLELRGRRSR